jgi:hypothetical protein
MEIVKRDTCTKETSRLIRDEYVEKSVLKWFEFLTGSLALYSKWNRIKFLMDDETRVVATVYNIFRIHTGRYSRFTYGDYILLPSPYTSSTDGMS